MRTEENSIARSIIKDDVEVCEWKACYLQWPTPGGSRPPARPPLLPYTVPGSWAVAFSDSERGKRETKCDQSLCWDSFRIMNGVILHHQTSQCIGVWDNDGCRGLTDGDLTDLFSMSVPCWPCRQAVSFLWVLCVTCLTRSRRFSTWNTCTHSDQQLLLYLEHRSGRISACYACFMTTKWS